MARWTLRSSRYVNLSLRTHVLFTAILVVPSSFMGPDSIKSAPVFWLTRPNLIASAPCFWHTRPDSVNSAPFLWLTRPDLIESGRGPKNQEPSLHQRPFWQSWFLVLSSWGPISFNLAIRTEPTRNQKPRTKLPPKTFLAILVLHSWFLEPDLRKSGLVCHERGSTKSGLVSNKKGADCVQSAPSSQEPRLLGSLWWKLGSWFLGLGLIQFSRAYETRSQISAKPQAEKEQER